MKTGRVVIVQCRLSSTRLPGKALKTLGSKTVLEWVLASMHKVNADRYFVATDFDSYETLKPYCEKSGFECFAGDLNDVLKRFCDLIKTLDCKTVIRATADNPFLFYEAAEASACDFEKRNRERVSCDYLTWTGLPHGSGVEIIKAESLLKAIDQTSDAYDHEHVGPALYNHRDKFYCEFVKAPFLYNQPHLRTTIDTQSDFLRAVQIVNYLEAKNEASPYTTAQIIEACSSQFVKTPVVLVPSVTKGHGTGHLRRCLSAACKTPYFVYIPEDKTLEGIDALIALYKEKGLKDWQIINFIPDSTYLPVIITDTFELTENQLEQFRQNQSFISIDEGSDYHNYCDYLLDIIPSFKLDREANFINADFMEKPDRTVECSSEKTVENILVCIGGEDPSDLTTPAIQALQKCFSSAKITAINSKLSEYVEEAGGANLEIVKEIPDLKNQLYKFDLVVTHYGLTAFEAMYSGCKVILLPTSKLHVNLAKKYSFAFLNKDKVNENGIAQALKSENIYPKFNKEKNSSEEENSDLSVFLKKVSSGEKIPCPVCRVQQKIPDKVISRNISRTYRRCQNCGIVYMAFSTEENKEYTKSYFFEDYKKQYGKTYQEDFDSIKEQGKRRLTSIQSVMGFTHLRDKNLLDIGCAYGPFLKACSEAGMNCFGTDISEDAVKYVQHELRFPATVSAFPDIDIAAEFGISQFDIVTMWYVIEHFKNLKDVLEKVSVITKKGGIFAFSTPSGEGISCKSDLNHFYQISPTDHFTVWEPSKANKILQKFGFEIVRIVSTGHHPERFPQIKKNEAKKGSLQWKIADAVSRAKKLGDTCEIYCKKI